MHDAYLLGGLAISFANAWEENRRDQHSMTMSNKESALHDAIERIQDPDGPNEERSHAEIMQFLTKDTEVC